MKKRKMLSLALAFALIMSLVPVSGLAAEPSVFMDPGAVMQEDAEEAVSTEAASAENGEEFFSPDMDEAQGQVPGEAAGETEAAEVEEPAVEESEAEEPIEETRFVMPTEEESEEEAIGEEFAAKEPATEEPIAGTEEPAEAAAAETADDGEASAEEAAAAETADDSEAFAEAEPVKDASGPNPFRYRNKGRKQKKVWKPGNMTALKEKAKDQTK